MQFNLVWIFLFHLPINLAKDLLQSGSIHNVQKLSSIKNIALNNGNYTKLSIQKLHLFKLITYAPKQSIMSNPLMSNASTISTIKFLRETNSLLSDHQFGFQQARSTGDLLAYAVHAWSSALESYGESRVISLDISKAFDRVWHKGLLAKLPMFGLHHYLIKWISSFLSDRTISIRVDGYLSNPHSINSGVPQSSIISPVWFIL